MREPTSPASKIADLIESGSYPVEEPILYRVPRRRLPVGQLNHTAEWLETAR
jgi:hypothetical protein